MKTRMHIPTIPHGVTIHLSIGTRVRYAESKRTQAITFMTTLAIHPVTPADIPVPHLMTTRRRGTITRLTIGTSAPFAASKRTQQHTLTTILATLPVTLAAILVL